MEGFVLGREDLYVISPLKITDYEINLDEETNSKSSFKVIKTEGLEKDNFIVINGLYKQFIFIIDEVSTEKDSNTVTITTLDISNIFDRKLIEENTVLMTTDSIEEFIRQTINNNFINSDDSVLNVSYYDIYINTSTQGIVDTGAENGLYNFHTFLLNCRQYKSIYTDFEIVFDSTGQNTPKLKITIEKKNLNTQLIDTTLPEIAEYNKVYEEDVTAKVTVLIRKDNSTYNLYLKNDGTTTTNKNDANRVKGKIEIITVDTADKASEEALNVMKGNRYNHLVEFKIAKTSKLMDVTKLDIQTPVRIRTEDNIYDSYISAITIRDENYIYFKTGNMRITLVDKLKSGNSSIGNKLDINGGELKGKVVYGAEGLFSPNINGVYFNQYGNIVLNPNSTSSSANWNISDKNGNVRVRFYFSNGHLQMSDGNNNAVISAGGGNVYIRPKGPENTSEQASISNEGNLSLNGNIHSTTIYNDTVSSATNLYIASSGWMHRTTNTSARRYKKYIKSLENNEELNPENLYDLDVKQFKYKEAYQPNENDSRYNKTLIGFIAEDLEELFPIAVDYNENGEVDNWNERYLIPAMMKLIQNQKKEIDNLKERLEKLEEGK